MIVNNRRQNVVMLPYHMVKLYVNNARVAYNKITVNNKGGLFAVHAGIYF
jgi:hypothetical protein